MGYMSIIEPILLARGMVGSLIGQVWVKYFPFGSCKWPKPQSSHRINSGGSPHVLLVKHLRSTWFLGTLKNLTDAPNLSEATGLKAILLQEPWRRLKT